ncbi:MAG: M23 family metallopeptidase [Alkalispirochaeta sp.]
MTDIRTTNLRRVPVAAPGIILITIVLAISGCAREVVEEPFEPTESYDSYRSALTALDLEETAMGSAWIEVGDERVRDPVSTGTPLREIVYFDPANPDAVTYLFPVSRGRRIEITIDSEHDRYFADLFRAPNGDPARIDELVHVATRDTDTGQIVFEARSNEYYLLRLQPELLRGGRFDIAIVENAPLAFPVEGAGPGDIWSFFGDSRDGGARIHHGVDIFAPRGTPVVAVSDSRVIRVGQRDLGGNVVVLRDEERDILLYYAHLDEHRTVEGRSVSAGDIIGTMGNTGNAITTPPHLHIGVYQGGWRNPVDPWGYFVSPAVTEPTPPENDTLPGQWMVLRNATTATPATPVPTVATAVVPNRNPFLQGAGDTFTGAELPGDDGFPPPREIRSVAAPAGVAVQVIGVSGDRARIRTVTGNHLFIPVDALDIGSATRDARSTGSSVVLRDIFTDDAIGEVSDAGTYQVVGELSGNSVVQLENGRIAWMDTSP